MIVIFVSASAMIVENSILAVVGFIPDYHRFGIMIDLRNTIIPISAWPLASLYVYR